MKNQFHNAMLVKLFLDHLILDNMNGQNKTSVLPESSPEVYNFDNL